MISAQIRAQVRERAQNACEYCQLHQDDSPLAALHVEHVIPRVHCGSDDVENLALACIDCNLHKGTNLGCCSEGKIVGTASAVLKAEFLYVRAMAVLPAARGRRVGESLLSESVRYAT